MLAKLLLKVFGLGKKGDPIISPDAIPQLPSFGHGPCVSSHDLFSYEKPQNGNVSEAAEQELFVTGLVEPGSGPFRMHVPTPQESQPDIGIKEILGVHRCVRWSR